MKSLNLLANAVIAGVLVHYICLITDAGFTYLLQIFFRDLHREKPGVVASRFSFYRVLYTKSL